MHKHMEMTQHELLRLARAGLEVEAQRIAEQLRHIDAQLAALGFKPLPQVAGEGSNPGYAQSPPGKKKVWTPEQKARQQELMKRKWGEWREKGRRGGMKLAKR
jgi:hypothetical protein